MSFSCSVLATAPFKPAPRRHKNWSKNRRPFENNHKFIAGTCFSWEQRCKYLHLNASTTARTAERLPSNSDSGILTPRGNVNLANSQWKHRSSYLQRLSKYPEVVEVPDYRFLCIRRNLAVICLTDPGVQIISRREYPTCERCYYPRRWYNTVFLGRSQTPHASLRAGGVWAREKELTTLIYRYVQY